MSFIWKVRSFLKLTTEKYEAREFAVPLKASSDAWVHTRCPQGWHCGTVSRAFPLPPSGRRRCNQCQHVMATHCLHSIKTTRSTSNCQFQTFRPLCGPYWSSHRMAENTR